MHKYLCAVPNATKLNGAFDVAQTVSVSVKDDYTILEMNGIETRQYTLDL